MAANRLAADRELPGDERPDHAQCRPEKGLALCVDRPGWGFIIEAWGTLSALWTYYTFETPPLWIIPVWLIAALSVNRLFGLAGTLFKKASERWFNRLYWPIFGVLYLFLWRFAWPDLAHPLTWFALAFCAVIILSEQDRRAAVLIMAVGSGLGYFLERWGTTRLCWAYHTGDMPPWITVLSHGMASLAIWRVYRVYLALVRRINAPWVNNIIPPGQI